MDIKKLFEDNTNSEGIIDIPKIQSEINLEMEATIKNSVEQQTAEFKDEMNKLREANIKYESTNTSLLDSETFYKEKIAKLTEENNVFSKKQATIDFLERANKANVSQEIIDDFLKQENINLEAVNLSLYTNTGGEKNTSVELGYTNNQSNEVDDLFDFMDK